MERSSAAARTRLLQELSRSRLSSSSREEEFATADSFDIDHDAVIHSTAQMAEFTTQRAQTQAQAQAQRHNHQAPDDGTEGSADMSIEVGRGARRGVHADTHDLSSSVIFNMGDDSLYEVTGTPPVKSRKPSKQVNGTLGREASVRQASQVSKSNEVARRVGSGTAHRTLAEALGRAPAPDDTLLAEELPSRTTVPRNTRFAQARQVSGPQILHLPANNPTAQSGTYTANSFMLPDLSNIVELVSGTRKDATPGFSRKSKSNSRFTSGSYKPLRPDHARVEGVPIPTEEQALYASLQLLKEKVAQLELEKSAAEKRAEQCEHAVTDLRTQLHLAHRRPDSALGSDSDEHAPDKLRKEKSRLEASVKMLQERVSRSEQKLSVSSITVDRVVQEREQLISQIGVAYHENEELKRENDIFRENYVKLQDEKDSLAEKAEELRLENLQLRQLTQTRDKKSASDGKSLTLKARNAATDDVRATRNERHKLRQHSTTLVEETKSDDIALRIAREVQRHRDHAAATNGAAHASTHKQKQSRSRPRSKSRARRHSDNQSGGLEREGSEADTTEFEITEKTREILKDFRIPAVSKRATIPDNSRDLTLLSDFDPDEYAKLRKKIEEEHRGNRGGRTVSAPDQIQRDDTSRSAAPRKPSLKDLSLNRELADAATKMPKSVRVQSPRASDGSVLPPPTVEGEDVSMVSNTGRRRRAISAEGMTSAFIVPDITLHQDQSSPMHHIKNCIQHDASGCTMCHRGDENVSIPQPVPVSERATMEDPDITSATIRPAQAPPLALATVIKQLEDEIVHLKLQLQAQSKLLLEHVPALSQRKRRLVSGRIHHLTTEINRRSGQVYALHDVLEGQKQAAARGEDVQADTVEETLMSLGLDPEELSGRVGRDAPSPGLDDLRSEASDDELPWEGLSDHSEEEQ